MFRETCRTRIQPGKNREREHNVGKMREERLLQERLGKRGYCREDQGREVNVGKIREDEGKEVNVGKRGLCRENQGREHNKGKNQGRVVTEENYCEIF